MCADRSVPSSAACLALLLGQHAAADEWEGLQSPAVQHLSQHQHAYPPRSPGVDVIKALRCEPIVAIEACVGFAMAVCA
jgi:hypothetical protein